MVNVHKQLVASIAVPTLLLGTATLAPVSHAEEAVLIPGATVFKRINPIYPTVATTYPDIGVHFHTDETPGVVKYSQNALDSDRAIADGVRAAKSAVEQTDGKVVVIGESMGSMVAWRVAAELANGDDPPDPDDIRFVVIAPPEAGIAEYFPEGTFIPILNYRVTRIAESPYPTTIVIGEYDGWADPPDRPWNLRKCQRPAGCGYVHGPPIFTAIPTTYRRRTSAPVRTAGQIHLVPTENCPDPGFRPRRPRRGRRRGRPDAAPGDRRRVSPPR